MTEVAAETSGHSSSGCSEQKLVSHSSSLISRHEHHTTPVSLGRLSSGVVLFVRVTHAPRVQAAHSEQYDHVFHEHMHPVLLDQMRENASGDVAMESQSAKHHPFAGGLASPFAHGYCDPFPSSTICGPSQRDPVWRCPVVL